MCTETEMKELLDRTRRLESRMVQLGDFVGANLRSKQRIEVRLRQPSETAYVVIDALDVSVSRIVTELWQHGVRHGLVDVILGGPKPAFTINLDNCK